MFAGNFALLEHNCDAKKDPDHTEGGERKKRNQQDRHKCLLVLIFGPGTWLGRDIGHEFL